MWIGVEEHTGELCEEARDNRALKVWVSGSSRPGSCQTYLPDKSMYADDAPK